MEKMVSSLKETEYDSGLIIRSRNFSSPRERRFFTSSCDGSNGENRSDDGGSWAWAQGRRRRPAARNARCGLSRRARAEV